MRNKALFIALWLFVGVALAVTSCAKSAELLTCPDGQESCGAICVSLKTDSENCGKCGSLCPADQACVAGACASACPKGNTKCGKDGGASYCVNANTDNENCGTCGKVCATGQVCFGGACSGTCGDQNSGQTLCGGDGGAAYCANLKTDRQNCGKCGQPCASGQLCTFGVCTGVCVSGQTLCGADAGTPYCANLDTDNANCGTCGKTCGTLESCSGGTCVSQCGPNQKLCTADGGAPFCADTFSDNKNCGTCGNVCPVNKPICSGGVCNAGAGGGTVRDVNGVISNVTYVKCGSGLAGACTEPVAENSCTSIGLKLISHASNGTVGVVSLGATVSCYWSISYFTNNDALVANQCLVGVSNANWSQCCTLGSWHGNVVTVPGTLGTQFGYCEANTSGYNSGLSNVSGTTFGCIGNASPAPARPGCTTYYVACK